MIGLEKLLVGICTALSITMTSVTLAAPTALIQNLDNGEQQIVVTYGTSLTAGGLWVPQITSFLNGQYPGQITWINSGLSGKASNSGVENLQTRVLDNNPDAVFIEFAMNDSFIAYEDGHIDKDISVTEARANLESMIHRITTQNSNAEVILQTMNPSWNAPNGNMSGAKRPILTDYYQMYRDVADSQSLPLVDNNRVWTSLQSNDPLEFQSRVSDGTHPDSIGYQRYVTSAVLYKIGANIGPSLVIDMQSGRALLHNQSDDESELIAYTISSSSGALLDDWSGIAAQEPGVWKKANATANYLSELTNGAALNLAAGEVRELGTAWDTSASLNLQFQYQTANGILHDGHLIFLNDTLHLTSLAGDYNGDGAVNAADYTVWRDNLGENASVFTPGTREASNSGTVNESDYAYWVSNYGRSSDMADLMPAIVIPEPGCLQLVAWIALYSRLVWLR